MALTEGLVISCSTNNCVGGISNLYLANESDVVSWTPGTTGVYTAVVMDGGALFYEFGFQDFTGEFRENGAPTENGCAQVITQEIEATFPCNTVAVRNALEELFSSVCCGVIAIVKKFDGTMWVVGELDKRHLKFLSSTGTSGKALSDSQQTTLVLQALTTELAHQFTGTVPLV
jgi:hypothetical protein